MVTEKETPTRPGVGRVKDARGRKVTQVDPVAMHLLRRYDVIEADDLRRIATDIDSSELKKRRRFALFVPIIVMANFGGFFGYFYVFGRWRGWDPVLIMFACLYVLLPFVFLYRGFRKARRARWERIRGAMLKHLRCPHCGYDIRGLPVAPQDDATVCPECGCAWALEGVAADNPSTG